MGVKGLWQFLDLFEKEQLVASSDASQEGLIFKETRLEELQGKVLAVDVSIWLYHFVKAIPSESKDTLSISPVVISGLFQRVCKLLHYGVKPIFVFDGAAPTLKKETIAARQHSKSRSEADFTKIAKKILKTRMKLLALGQEVKTEDYKDEGEMKKPLPPIDLLSGLEGSSEYSEEEMDDDFELLEKDTTLYDIDTNSSEFKKLPFVIQEQIILSSRKRTIDPSIAIESELSPTKSNDAALDFSKAQVEGLIKRRRLMGELDALRGGVKTTATSANHSEIEIGRIASASSKQYVFVKNTRAGWTLSLNEEENPSSNQPANPSEESQKQKSLSEIEDDEEFMNTLFGSVDAGEKPAKDKVPIVSIQNVPSNSESVMAVSSEDEIIDLDFKVRPSENWKECSKPELSFKSESEYEGEVGEELPGFIFEGLAKPTRVAESTEPAHLETVPDADCSEFIERVSRAIGKDSSSVQDKEYNQIIQDLRDELKQFNEMKDTSLALASSPTKLLTDLFIEMLHLLQLPFLLSPFEAEAQCSALSDIDGIISDDSDCLLFGGKVIYRGMFGSKFKGAGLTKVEFDFNEIGLSRDDLIAMAHILGCDYCPGIEGIGPKRALQIFKSAKSHREDASVESTLAAIKSIEEEYKWLKGKLSARFGDPRITEAFKRPIVAEVASNTIHWGRIQERELERFMNIHAKWPRDRTALVLRDLLKRQAK